MRFLKALRRHFEYFILRTRRFSTPIQQPELERNLPTLFGRFRTKLENAGFSSEIVHRPKGVQLRVPLRSWVSIWPTRRVIVEIGNSGGWGLSIRFEAFGYLRFFSYVFVGFMGLWFCGVIVEFIVLTIQTGRWKGMALVLMLGAGIGFGIFMLVVLSLINWWYAFWTSRPFAEVLKILVGAAKDPSVQSP